MLGIPITHDGSDSQDMDRAMHGLIVNHGLSLIEASEVIFPPMAEEVDALPDDLRALYRYYRWVLGPLAQGPAAIVSRYGDECVFGVDALGLRPLWFGELATEYFFASEQGVVPLAVILGDPKPLAPGEKVAINVRRGEGSDVLPYHELQRAALDRSQGRWDLDRWKRRSGAARCVSTPQANVSASDNAIALPVLPHEANRVAAFHWATQDVDYVEALCKTGNEPIGSLGYDGPLAALSPEKQSLADYFKEAVAVVTNPAMDREREMEHFSTRMTLGARPGLTRRRRRARSAPIELKVPILTDLAVLYGQIPRRADRSHSRQSRHMHAGRRLRPLRPDAGACSADRLCRRRKPCSRPSKRLAERAVEAVRRGAASLIVLDDMRRVCAGHAAD